MNAIGLIAYGFAILLGGPGPGSGDSQTDPLRRGHQLLAAGACDRALEAFKDAGGEGKGRSPEAWLGVAQAQQCRGAFKESVKACDRVLTLAPEAAGIQVRAHNLKGIALTALGRRGGKHELAQAEVEFRKALELGDEPEVRYNLAFLLMGQARDAEGAAVLKALLERTPPAALAERARQLLAEPRRAREDFAPDLSLSLADGKSVALQDLKGKVVLLDFWASWCRPCLEGLPSLARLRKKFPEDRLAIVGLSVDEPEAWEAALARHTMPWLQARNPEAARQLHVNAFPTYWVINREGMIRYRHRGWDRGAGLALESEIKKCLASPLGASAPGSP